MKLGILPVLNLRRKPLRTIALIVTAMVMSAAIFGGCVFVEALQKGLDSLEQRLGADIIVLPEGAENKVDLKNILLQGTPGYFYMDKSVTEKLSAVEGVEKLSPQYFLVSANAECCTVQVQIIGFDEDTDITVKPWLREAYSGSLGDNGRKGQRSQNDGEPGHGRICRDPVSRAPCIHSYLQPYQHKHHRESQGDRDNQGPRVQPARSVCICVP